MWARSRANLSCNCIGAIKLNNFFFVSLTQMDFRMDLQSSELVAYWQHFSDVRVLVFWVLVNGIVVSHRLIRCRMCYLNLIRVFTVVPLSIHVHAIVHTQRILFLFLHQTKKNIRFFWGLVLFVVWKSNALVYEH